MPVLYFCRKCGKNYSESEVIANSYCRNCGTFLSDKFVKYSARIHPLPEDVTKKYCRDYEISTLYHITPTENIPSIMHYGLLCHNLVKEGNISNVSCSNPEIQENRSRRPVGDLTANDYVPLFFSEKPPMLWAIEHNKEHFDKVMVYICIKGEIIGEEGVCFSDGNIAANKTTKYYDIEDLEKLEWEKIRKWNPDECGFEEAKRIKSAEVLVPSRIERSWFQKLIVPRPREKRILEILLPKHISIVIKPEFYYTFIG